MSVVPNTCAGCKYACTVSWHGGTSTILEDCCQTRCDLKKREITLADENCYLKEVNIAAHNRVAKAVAKAAGEEAAQCKGCFLMTPDYPSDVEAVMAWNKRMSNQERK